MKPGDMIRIRAPSHGYPVGYKSGEPVIKFLSDTTGIYLDEIVETGGGYTRTFYNVITDHGVVSIFSDFTNDVG